MFPLKNRMITPSRIQQNERTYTCYYTSRLWYTVGSKHIQLQYDINIV